MKKRNRIILLVDFSEYSENLTAFDLLKERVELTEDSFLVLQQGSRSLSDKLFRKFMVNELVFNAKTPLIVLSL